TRSIAPHRG
ncbi:hypothetical protein CP8484711_0770B, partial [Chlamydia psittaci 84-8471/1]